MYRWLLIFACLLFAPHAKADASNTLNCPCTPGTSCTVDSGKVTAYCGIQSSPQTACPSGALYSYASSPFATFSNAMQPCMDVYYNTADGPTNHNITLVIGPEGGNATNGTDWALGFSVTNGSMSPGLWGLVDGSTFNGTAAQGMHINVAVPQTQSWAALQTSSAITAGVANPTVTLSNAANHYFAGGTVCFDVGSNQECFPATASFAGSSPWTVTLTVTGTPAYNHASGVYAWAQDSNGQGSPTYPTYYKWSVCDYARFMNYFDTQMGNGQYAYITISGTTNVESSLMAYGQSIEGMAAPKGCGLAAWDGIWNIVASELISPLVDEGLGCVSNLLGANQTAVSGCQSVSFGGGTSWSFIMGAFAGTLNNGVGAASISSPLTYSGGVVNLTALNSLAQACRNTTLAGCIPGTANNCTYPTNAFIGLSYVDGGGEDTANPCSQQGAMGYSGPGFHATIQPTQGHTALYYENYTADGDCGTSAYTDQQGICPNSYAYLHLVAMLENLHVYGNVSRSGITGAGVY